jgi:predicted ATP-binding protein involved in virulence
MIEPRPPDDQEVSYVGVWLDDHTRGESYEQDRWAPFVRCVIAWVGQEADWLRHARPLFGGTSFLSAIWHPRFRRPHVEGIFVEVPRSLAARLKHGLHNAFSVRGLLQVEQLEERAFVPHLLANSGWLLGDICVPRGEAEGSDFHEQVGLRIAYPREGEASHPSLDVGPRSEADYLLTEIVGRGVHAPAHRRVKRGPTATPIELLVVRTAEDMWSTQPFIPAYLTLFDLEQTSHDFEERLVEVVSAQLALKAYRSEVVLWFWIGAAAHHPKTYYAAITTGGNQKAARTTALFKGLRPAFFEAGEDRLETSARPLLRWRPEEGLTRFWTAAPPPDTLWSRGKISVHLRHRVPHVVRAAEEARELRFDGIELHNVRNHDSFKHRFDPHFNVIIGDNAQGKTTILDALAAVLRAVGSPKDSGESLRAEDVTERLVIHDESVTVERQFPARISAIVHLQPRSSVREQLTRTEQGATREGGLSNWMERLIGSTRRGIPVDLPLVAYYGVARAHQPTAHVALEVTPPASRLDGYVGALDGRLDPLPFQRWFKTMELAALQERRPSVLLEVVREAVRRCVEDCETVQHLVGRDEVAMLLRDGRVVPFRQLSDGYRLTLAMVADIAFRCVSLNPHLGPAATQATAGVVLVDELDLHLHPRWQRHIVRDLRGAFPMLQFIVTTHSPFIVQSMGAEAVRSLDNPEVRMDYQKSSIEDIAEEAMGVADVQRSRRFHDMEEAAAEYYRLLETKPANDAEAQRLKARLDELMLPFADNPAYVAFLNMHRVARKGLS